MTYLLWGDICCDVLAQACLYLAGPSGSLARASGCAGFNVCILAVAPVAV